ncbi:Peptidoglycan/LPS O-acetylase OafA/YrhL, contains acyltransferase and SGNH-hydrolase domains [Promicromonospora umidemergens]|uniref:SGNH hydrolase domain-containing protein n=1 Tax=Promicromonospora umidemergens TaxID=629679 RepID=A0ABP8WB93_9MICO|nr:acyltransferase family protein [Promicromonospora umidemergens]MCP2284473.1 Peptidoglycan/LPS O-acetylase OafA/YrhL, contains acyltransferase and SGNH-hydrolase domains [Promicromonospora umidemergens]
MTGLAAPAASVDGPTRSTSGGGFRADIEGLRAVAIGLVLLYHADVPFLPGGYVGVDMFFVVSGYLITGLLVREVERTGRVSLARFYARRAKRLLPASALVLVVSALLMWATASVVQWRAFGHDIVAAALYVVNWRMADRSVDYLAEGTGASPVQHFWSLAVEEQFYLVWPLVLVLVALVARRYGLRVRPLMGVGLALIVVPSFVWALSTSGSPSGFFVTTTRLWELGVGALVAVAGAVALPRAVARMTGIVGLTLVVGSAVLLDHTTPWPGAWTLLPVLGTAAVIFAGTSHERGAPRVLQLPAVVWIGGLSYSLYLWHWPLLVAAENVAGELSVIERLVVVAVSVVPAWLSLRFVENPVRFSGRLAGSNPVTLGLGAGLTAVGVIAGLLLAAAVPNAPTGSAAAGAAALVSKGGAITPPQAVAQGAVTPSAALATDDVPAPYRDGCEVAMDEVELELCVYGDPQGSKTMVLAGDSKALQWFTPLESIARENGWRLVLATKSACGFAGAVRPGADGAPYTLCGTYNEALLAELLEVRPDAVITSQVHDTAYDATGELTEDAMTEGLTSYWSQLEESGTDVIALLDNPQPHDVPVGGSEVYMCVAEFPDQLDRCAFSSPERATSGGSGAQVAAAAEVEDADVVDMNDLVCNEDVCPAVIGGVLVYRQGSHLTDSYVRSMTPVLEERLLPFVENR